MKSLILALSFLVQIQAQAAFPSTVNGLEIPNAHLVAESEGRVFRGSQPLGKEAELVDLGITDVIIFKNETKNEVQTEIENLKEAGYSEENIHHIPFRWKQIESEESQCEMVIEALQVMKEVYDSKDRAVYFHCTVGEDRTGLLAGVFKLLVGDEDAATVFQDEMCGNGYEAGNPGKPAQVVKSIRDELTPTYVKLAALIKAGKLNYENLNAKVCKKVSSIKAAMRGWKCQ
jgi:hypothetical protein